MIEAGTRSSHPARFSARSATATHVSQASNRRAPNSLNRGDRMVSCELHESDAGVDGGVTEVDEALLSVFFGNGKLGAALYNTFNRSLSLLHDIPDDLGVNSYQ